MKNEKGFTLVEVIASLVIITIILLSFYPLIINAKKLSNSNIERLVVINLAEATLNRLKVSPYDYIFEPSEKPEYLFKEKGYQQFSSSNCYEINCELFSQELNDKTFHFEITASQKEEESDNNLINIVVTAKNEKGNIRYSVEGYIPYENQ